jgi:hypothetical protein
MEEQLSNMPGARERVRKFRLFGREFPLPQSRLARIAIGVNLVFFGMLGFLPVLGFWMIPLGLLVLSVDIAIIRRLRRRMIVYANGRRRKPRRKQG